MSQEAGAPHADAPRNPYGATPPRRAGSIRRTSTIDTHWPDGRGTPMRMHGHARDLITKPDGSTIIVAEDRIDVLASPMREILALTTTPARAGADRLIGIRAGGHLRAALNAALPDEREAGTPLYLLLDDLAGASLVAGWAWSRWIDDWMKRIRQDGTLSTAGKGGHMTGICTGFAPGSSALLPDGSSYPVQNAYAVPPLENPDDPVSWHALAEQQGVGMRRARRLDIWRDGDAIRIDAHFQDSATSPQGGRIAVHEYGATARAGEDFRLRDVHADPRILPYRECPGAGANVTRMVGEPLAAFRLGVPTILAGIAGCTHLNDVLRSLAEVPQLAAALTKSVLF